MATTPSWVKIPEVVAEVTAAFARYEAALVGNDVDALNELFWDTRHTVCYGVTACTVP